jgi:hypothetical protein
MSTPLQEDWKDNWWDTLALWAHNSKQSDRWEAIINWAASDNWII